MLWREEEEAVQIRLLESSLRWIYQDENTVCCHWMYLRLRMNGPSLYGNIVFTGRLKLYFVLR